LKVPQKTKIFIWFLSRQELLTKDNLIKDLGRVVQNVCSFDAHESIEHLFLSLVLLRDQFEELFILFLIFVPQLILLICLGTGCEGSNSLGVCALLWAI
jgi:hypothetical protein